MRARVAYDPMLRRRALRAPHLVSRVLALVLGGAGLLSLVACGDDPSPSPRAPAPMATAATRLPTPPTTSAPASSPAGSKLASPPPALPAPPASRASDERPTPERSVRWYEGRIDGKRMSTLEVVWTPSTWKGKKTVRDVTTERRAEAREMGPMVDVFSSVTVTETDRGEDGTLWFTRSNRREAQGEGRADRLTVEQTTWTGDGYDHVATLNGVEERRRVSTPTPTALDAESFLGARIARGELKPGDTFALRMADVVKERVVEHSLVVVGPETWEGPEGPIATTRVRETDPETKNVVHEWFDATGAIVRLKNGSLEIRRISEASAKDRQAEPASFSITLEASPPIERSFSADRMLVDVHLKPDPDRPLPELPDSPWSRPLSVEGDDAKGWTIHTEFRAYDAPAGVQATIPVTDPAFAKDLKPTLLMPCQNVDVVKAAKDAIGGETDARRAVAKLSEFVFTRLKKQSGPVPDATAVEILRDKMGDCSEHALLFVALCRAAGIPARRCSGFVCVGSLWGGHAWAEVWVGAWMGVDPTTNDVGTSARYLFYGYPYPDDPDSREGMVSSLLARRMSLDVIRLEEGGEVVDLTKPETLRVVDEEGRRADQRLVGLSFRDLPKDWHVTLPDEDGEAIVRGPGFVADVHASADQGYRGTRNLRRHAKWPNAREVLFAGAPAVVVSKDRERVVAVASRRRVVRIDLEASDADPAPDLDEVLKRLEAVMAPSFTPKPDGK